MIFINGKKVATTTEGYLKNVEDWSEDVATYLSERDNLTLTAAHWQIIRFMRKYFLEYGITPNQRVLQKLVREEFGEDMADLSQLFHYDAAKQAARYAGLPKPTGCI